MAYRDLFPRNLGDPSKRSSRRKRYGGWPSGLDLSERTSEGTIAYSWRGEYDRQCVRVSETVNAQNSGGVNELGHVRSRPGPPPRLYPLYRGLVFPMGPRLISWLCESDARTRPRIDNAKRDRFLDQSFRNSSILYNYIQRYSATRHHTYDCMPIRKYLQYTISLRSWLDIAQALLNNLYARLYQ